MRRLVAFTTLVALALSLASVPLAAAGGSRVPRLPARPGANQTTGSIAGRAEDSRHRVLANHTVRIRNLANGNLTGSTTTSTSGDFSFIGLTQGNYAIEVVNTAGDIIATSASIAVAPGATVSVTITASAAAAIREAAAAGGHGRNTALIVTGVATAAGVGVYIATRSDPSPRR